MSKPISISFGKSKTSLAPAPGSGLQGRKPISFTPKASKPALRHDSDDEDEEAPRHEEVTGFSADGVILGKPVEQKGALVIKNAGNGDWRTRGKKNLLPAEVQAQREAQAKPKVVVVERNEVSNASGLQFAELKTGEVMTNGHTNGESIAASEPAKVLTEDEIALQALLGQEAGEREKTAIIVQAANARPQSIAEADDFKADVASRPDIPTLDEYAAMPVEEFGLAMLRGMGQKRNANGEFKDYGSSHNKAPKIREARQGYLGIGAKAAPGAEAELGAWGKADLRKNKKGEGLYTPVMLRDKRTGEMITEEELEKRKEKSKQGIKKDEDGWNRKDRSPENGDRISRNGEEKYITDKDDYRDQMNEFSRNSSSRKDRDSEQSLRSERDRSRSGERSRRRNKYRDDDRYDSGSSRRSYHRDRDVDRDRRREGERNRRRDR